MSKYTHTHIYTLVKFTEQLRGQLQPVYVNIAALSCGYYQNQVLFHQLHQHTRLWVDDAVVGRSRMDFP